MEGYPPNTGGYPPNTGGYPPNTGGYPPNTGGYPPNQGVNPPNQGGYPPNQGGYPPTTGGYPPNQGGYPPNTGGYPPTGGGYPPNQPTPSPFHTPNQGISPAYPNFNVAAPYPNAQTPSPGGFPAVPGGVSPNTAVPPGGFPPVDKMQSDSEPGAPPLSEIKDLPGYEGITYDSSILKPPSYDDAMGAPLQPSAILENAPSLTEEEARESLLEYVSDHCCYGTGAAKKMAIKDITFNSAIHYTLETFGEKRETAWVFEPYEGGQLTVQAGGFIPGPWEIDVRNEKGEFKNNTQIVEVPNTSNLRPCHKCIALGRCRCKHCFGMGHKNCTWCSGAGRKTGINQGQQCTSCHGSGRDRCTWCHGHGHVVCDVCKGKCQLRYYIKLTVTWTNHNDDHISDIEEMPRELVRMVTGQIAFEDTQPRVWPISNYPDAAVNAASQKLVEEHKSYFQQERILQQRQKVRIIPIAKAEYNWKGSAGHFFVYGYEKKVYFQDYPQSCCCGCQIL